MNQPAKRWRFTSVWFAILATIVCAVTVLFTRPLEVMDSPIAAGKHATENAGADASALDVTASGGSKSAADTSASELEGSSNHSPNANESAKRTSTNTQSAPAATKSATATPTAKSTIEFFQGMDDHTFVDWLMTEWLNSQQPGYQPPNLDEDASNLAFEQRATALLQELRESATAGHPGASNLLSMILRQCARTQRSGCPPAAEAQAEAERIDWAAAEAGEAYPMVMLWMDGTHRESENYYRDHVATIERMRPIMEKNVQLGDCVALDWLAASFGLYVEIAPYRQPLISYRYRFALLHAPFASQRTKDTSRKQVARAQEQIRPELLRAEEKIALELVQKSFQADTPNCKMVRDEEFNFAQANR